MIIQKMFQAKWMMFAAFCFLHVLAWAESSNEINIAPAGENRVESGATLTLTCSYFFNFSTVRWTNPSGETIATTSEDTSVESRKLIVRLKNLSKEMSGIYVCEGQRGNGQPSINQTTSVVVYDGIKFEDAPKVQKFKRNTTAEIKCIVSGDPSIYVLWEIGGVPLDPRRTSGRIFENKTAMSILVIENIQTNDSNSYVCLAELQTYGKSKQQTIQVTVEYPPSDVTVNYPEPELENGSVTLTCNADADPAPSYVWFFEDGNGARNESNKITKGLSSDGRNLTLENITVKDAGNYTCAVQNSYDIVNATTEVFVHVPPQITFENLEPFNESNRVDWTCKILQGIPKVQIGIYRHNKKLVTSDMDPNKTSTSISVLADPNDDSVTVIFQSVTPRDAGEYACIASNSVGTAIKRRELQVQYAPRWPKLPSTVQGCSDDVVRLQCQFLGNPLPELKWLVKTNLNMSSNPMSSTTTPSLPTANPPDMTLTTQETEVVEGFQSNEMVGLEGYKPIPIDGDVYETTMQDGVLSLEIKKFGASLYNTYYCMGRNILGPGIEPIKLIETTKPTDAVKFSIPENSITTVGAVVRISTPGEEAIDAYSLVLTNMDTSDKTYQTIKAEKGGEQSVALSSLQHDTQYLVNISAGNCKGYGPSEIANFNTRIITNPDPVEMTSETTSKFPTNYTLKWKTGSSGGGKLKSIIITYWPSIEPNSSIPDGAMKRLIISETDDEFENNAMTLTNLQPSTKYEGKIIVVNQVGNASASFSFATENESTTEANKGRKLAGGGLSTTIIIIIVSALLVLLIVVDIALWATRNCGFFHCVYVHACSGSSEQSGKKDVEEGSAKYKKKETAGCSTHIVIAENQPLAEEAEPIANGTEQEAAESNEETPFQNDQSNAQSHEEQKQETSAEINEKDTSSPEAQIENSDKEPLHQEAKE